MPIETKARSRNVRIVDGSTFKIECRQCLAVWSPNLGAGGRLPALWWQCPNLCNTPVPAASTVDAKQAKRINEITRHVN